ncbi:ATP-dependent RNA helicase [Nematocida major]|uniref:ATP-dependent RNA helicase n=1 Tax=Nematocida major TaxID=1912982 RepID=UPI00200768D1|nr:ATP-dependent RNA helicase [Nematocida major]KAH9385190.1 ATP-dependent RNA helicase [Nematocida major]
MHEHISEFESLQLKESLLKGVFAYGFSTPSQIQKDAIPSIASGESVVVQSKNGTGKTATFLLGVLQRMDPAKKGVQAIIVSPTRDLAIQTFNVFSGLSKFMSMRGHCAIGQDKKINADVSALQNCTVLFGTPGRLLHLTKESFKSFSNLQVVVLDEADRTLESGFGLPVKNLFETIKPLNPQFVFVSATLPSEVTEMLTLFLDEPKMFLVPQEKLALSQISQFYVKVPAKEKFETVCNILSVVTISQAVIFANRKETVSEICKKMQLHEFPAVAVHGSLEQAERNKRMGDFLSGKFRILVSTDVTSRGIDAAHVNLVINYDVPHTAEEYLHRIGRGGRFGKTSIAVTLTEPEEYNSAQNAFGAYGKTMQKFEMDKHSVYHQHSNE